MHLTPVPHPRSLLLGLFLPGRRQTHSSAGHRPRLRALKNLTIPEGVQSDTGLGESLSLRRHSLERLHGGRTRLCLHGPHEEHTDILTRLQAAHGGRSDKRRAKALILAGRSGEAALRLQRFPYRCSTGAGGGWRSQHLVKIFGSLGSQILTLTTSLAGFVLLCP